MRNTISERFDLLQKLGGLPEPEVINESGFYYPEGGDPKFHFK